MKWRYKKLEVEGDEIIEVPEGSRKMQITTSSNNKNSFVEWLEPVEDGE